MKRRPPRSTRTDTLVPDTTLCRSPKVQSTRTGDSPAQNANVDPDHRQAQGKQTKAEAEGDDGGGHFAAAFLAFGLAGAVRARNSSAHSSALPAAKPPPVSSPGLSPSDRKSTRLNSSH